MKITVTLETEIDTDTKIVTFFTKLTDLFKNEEREVKIGVGNENRSTKPKPAKRHGNDVREAILKNLSGSMKTLPELRKKLSHFSTLDYHLNQMLLKKTLFMKGKYFDTKED